MTLMFLSLLALLGWVYLAFFNGRFWIPLKEQTPLDPDEWPSVDIIVPARDEAELLPLTLRSLLTQDYPGAWRVILVDDHSGDGTGNVARTTAAKCKATERLTVIAAPEKPEGWAGKVAAMQAGVNESKSDYVLFTDADIIHDAGSLKRLVSEAIEMRYDLTSRMALLHCTATAEQLLIPAFVFFFAMLYPFRRAGNPEKKAAAAAGGVMLLKRKALDNAGGLARIKSEIIDDCALAKAIKQAGGRQATPGRIWLSMTDRVKSMRRYPDVIDIWRMVARTAFTQLRYSPLLLAGTVLGMGLLFLVPDLAIMFGRNSRTIALGFLAWGVQIVLYFPTVRFYRLSPLWAASLPAAGLIYVGATIDSARLYWQGKGGQWKGRSQA